MGLSTNGKFTLANAIITLGCAAMLGVMGWTLSQTIALLEFRAAGDRFTQSDWHEQRALLIAELRAIYPPRWLVEDIADAKLELQRIQLQIDRLEGHDPNTYTEDHIHNE